MSCITTQDGIVWEQRFPIHNGNLIGKLGQIGGSNLQIVADGQDILGTYSSFDPIYWSFTPMPNREKSEKLHQIVFMGSYFVAIGDNGKIWISLAKDEMASLTKTNLTPKNRVSSQFRNIFLQIQQHSNSVSYSISQTQNVTLCLYSLNGKFISTLDKGRKTFGEHRVSFDGKKLCSGSYFLRLETEKQGCVNKSVVLY